MRVSNALVLSPGVTGSREDQQKDRQPEKASAEFRNAAAGVPDRQHLGFGHSRDALATKGNRRSP
jgi:hypothetical protein